MIIAKLSCLAFIAIFAVNGLSAYAATKGLTDPELKSVNAEYYGGSPEEIQENISLNCFWQSITRIAQNVIVTEIVNYKS